MRKIDIEKEGQEAEVGVEVRNINVEERGVVPVIGIILI